MDIWSMTRPALENWFSSRGENPAKAAILLERLYQRGLRDFSELPFAQRVISALSEEFTTELPETATTARRSCCWNIRTEALSRAFSCGRRTAGACAFPRR